MALYHKKTTKSRFYSKENFRKKIDKILSRKGKTVKYGELPNNHPLRHFPDRLSDAVERKKKIEHKTETQMLDEMGITSKGSLSVWQGGKNSVKIPDAVNIVKLARYFNVSADWLLGLSEKNIRTRKPNVRAAAELTRLSDKAVERLNSKPPFKPTTLEEVEKAIKEKTFKSMSPEEAERAIKEGKLKPRAWTDEEIALLSQMIEDDSLLKIISHINSYRKWAKMDALKRTRYRLTGKREEGMSIGTADGENEFIVDTDFSVSMEVEQHRAEKAITLYTEKMCESIEAEYAKIGEQNGRTNKKNKKGR